MRPFKKEFTTEYLVYKIFNNKIKVETFCFSLYLLFVEYLLLKLYNSFLNSSI